ncbi:MAG: hypothetical protein NVSMB9_24330 [Isosphaeraceae bacterium]
MSYEESFQFCSGCRRETWHGRHVADVYRARSLVTLSRLITVFTDRFVAWRCLDCGVRTRGKARPPASRTSS